MSDLYDADPRPLLALVAEESATPPWWLLGVPAALILAAALWLL